MRVERVLQTVAHCTTGGSVLSDGGIFRPLVEIGHVEPKAISLCPVVQVHVCERQQVIACEPPERSHLHKKLLKKKKSISQSISEE